MNWTKTEEGLEIYYEDKGHGPAIMFQSGYMGIHDIWKHQIKGLANSYRCITHDNRGFGLSSKPESSSYFTMEKNADDAKAVYDAAGLTEPMVIVTHSLGGMVAVAFARKYPDLVKGILMMGGPIFSPESMIAGGAHDEIWSCLQTTPSMCQAFYAGIGCSEEIALEAGKWTPTVFKNQTRAFLNYRATAADVAELTFPVLVLRGTEDFILPPEVPHEVVDAFPNAEWRELDGLLHFPQTQAPDTINQIIQEFCESCV